MILNLRLNSGFVCLALVLESRADSEFESCIVGCVRRNKKYVSMSHLSYMPYKMISFPKASSGYLVKLPDNSHDFAC